MTGRRLCDVTEDGLTRPEGLYRQVAQRLRQDITEGRYRPGDLLPSEAELARHFAVSRQTVRQAVAVLRAEALVESEQGRGTYIRRPPIRLPFSRYATRRPSVGPFEALCEALGIPGYGELVVVERRQADDVVAAGLNVDVGTEIIYRRRYMHAGAPDAIIQIQEGHLPLDIVDGTPLAGVEKIKDGTYAALEAIGHVPVRVTEEVSARSPTYTEVSVFRLMTGVPVLQVQRTTYDAADRVVEWLIVTAASDQNVFVYEDLPLI